MGTDLIRIGQKARKEPDLVFTSLYHHVTDVDNLRTCYGYLKPNKATGVDRVDKRAPDAQPRRSVPAAQGYEMPSSAKA